MLIVIYARDLPSIVYVLHHTQHSGVITSITLLRLCKGLLGKRGGERPAHRNSRQHWKMGSLSSFCCVKGTPRQDEGDCGRLSGFVDSLWRVLPSFYYFFPLSYHLSLTKDFSSEIDLLFTVSFVIDLLCRSHRNLRLLHTHTHSAHTQHVSWLIIIITNRFPVRRRRRYKREGKKKAPKIWERHAEVMRWKLLFAI